MTEDERLVAELGRLERASRPLEPGTTRRRRLREAVIASSERFLRGLAGRKAFRDTGEGPGVARQPIRDRGLPIEEAIGLLEREVIEPGGQPAVAGHVAYIPGGGLYHSALGDYLAAVSNKYAGLFFTGPGPVRMEQMLVRWVADLAGYPAPAGGHIASGGSLATLAAVVAARDAHGLKAAGYSRAAVYLTAQAHHCLMKALRFAGLAEAPLRYIPMDERFRMQPEALSRAIDQDRAAGLRPWLVAAAAGTTDTGAVDPLDALGEVARQAGCWFHVDAAYGGFFLLTASGRKRLRGIERSDSVVLDPHKGLFLPYGAGMVLVRHAGTTGGAAAAYLQDAPAEAEALAAAELSPELSKHFRALRMWLPLILLGTEPFRAALEEKLLLARYFYDRVRALGFEASEPDLSIVPFRLAPRGMPLDQANDLNRRLVEGIRRDGRVFLSSTMIDGRYTLRMAILSFRTHRKTVDLGLDILREQASRL